MEVRRLNACTSDSDSDDGSSSVASTIKFGHETFTTFQTKVFQIATAVFAHVDPSHITIEHIKGGSFNRVVGITIATPSPKKFSLPWFRKQLLGCIGRQKVKAPKNFVVRIPRYDSAGIDRDISVMKFVGPRLYFPVPATTAFELSDNNVLGKAWMLQPRLRGEQLSRVWETLNLSQKMSAANQVTKLYYGIMNITSRCAGNLVAGSNTPLGSAPAVETFAVPRLEHKLRDTFAPKSHTFPAVPQTPLAHLLEQCNRWRELQRASGLCYQHIWNGFTQIASRLHELGFLPDEELFCLFHNDLLGYNILIEITSKTTVKITGVLDWDGAAFAPSFMFRAPFWLWTEGDNALGKEETALIEPESDDAKKLKNVFMEGRGLNELNEQWGRYAFSKECMLARRMYPILQKGVFSSSEMAEAEAVIAEWRELHEFELKIPDLSFGEDDLGSNAYTLHDRDLVISDQDETNAEGKVVAIDMI